jgi:hypothetical protein
LGKEQLKLPSTWLKKGIVQLHVFTTENQMRHFAVTAMESEPDKGSFSGGCSLFDNCSQCGAMQVCAGKIHHLTITNSDQLILLKPAPSPRNKAVSKAQNSYE